MTATLTQQLAAKLTALGDTAPAVAVSLKAAGITGRHGSATSCPIANYLIGQADLSLDRAYVGCLTVQFRIGSLLAHLDTPAGPSEFIKAFDRGEYADLEYATAPGGDR